MHPQEKWSLRQKVEMVLLTLPVRNYVILVNNLEMPLNGSYFVILKLTNDKLAFYSGIIHLLSMQFNSWKWEGGSSTLPGNSSQPPAATQGTRAWELLCSDRSSPFFQTQIDPQRLLQCGVPSKSSERLQELHLMKTMASSLIIPLYCSI